MVSRILFAAVAAALFSSPMSEPMSDRARESSPEEPSARIALRLGLPRFVVEEDARAKGATDDVHLEERRDPLFRIRRRAAPLVRLFVLEERSRVTLLPPARALAEYVGATAERGQLVRSDDVLTGRIAFDLRAGIAIKADGAIRFEAMYGLAFRGNQGGGPDELFAALAGSSATYLRHGPWLAVRIDF